MLSRMLSAMQSFSKPFHKTAKLVLAGLVLVPTGYFVHNSLANEYFSTKHTNTYVMYSMYLGNILIFTTISAMTFLMSAAGKRAISVTTVTLPLAAYFANYISAFLADKMKILAPIPPMLAYSGLGSLVWMQNVGKKFEQFRPWGRLYILGIVLPLAALMFVFYGLLKMDRNVVEGRKKLQSYEIRFNKGNVKD